MVYLSNVNINKPFTWKKYSQKMCSDCMALCCQLAIEVKVADLVQMGIIDEFEGQGPIKQLAKKLKKEGVVRLFNLKREIFTLARSMDDTCIFLDSDLRKCTIYDRRPKTCRNHLKVGPRPGYCAYIKKKHDTK
ncbi:MAG: YkgJ family cysteine cluster protein [Bacteriovoracaceae bacterium]|nr:YkgJ family cysteine cluster protein [Bacteriovoracaceae bacterium]